MVAWFLSALLRWPLWPGWLLVRRTLVWDLPRDLLVRLRLRLRPATTTPSGSLFLRNAALVCHLPHLRKVFVGLSPARQLCLACVLASPVRHCSVVKDGGARLLISQASG